MMDDNGVKKRALIYGAGCNCVFSFQELDRRYEIVGIVDGAAEKQGKDLFGYRVSRLSELLPNDYDVLIVTPTYHGPDTRQLQDMGVPPEKVLSLGEALERETVPRNLRIAVLFHGGLGDFIVGKSWLYHVSKRYFPRHTVTDLFFLEEERALGQAIFGGAPGGGTISTVDLTRPDLLPGPEYDLVLRFLIIPTVERLDGPRVAALAPELYTYAGKLLRFAQENVNVGYFGTPHFYRTVNRLFQLFPEKKYYALWDLFDQFPVTEDYACPFSIAMDGEQYLSGLGLDGKPYVTINTGLGIAYRQKPCTRAWEMENWRQVAEKLKRAFPKLTLVQVGQPVVSAYAIPADLDLSGKTNLEQAKVLMKYALLHIDYEGGLVHLRHVLHGGPTVVLYGPTNVARYHYSENLAIYNGACTTPCAFQWSDWLMVCHGAAGRNVCMSQITPEQVFQTASNYLTAELGRMG